MAIHLPKRPILTRLFLSREERRLRAGWRLAGQFLLMVVFFLILGIPLGLLMLVFPSLPGEAILLASTLISFLAITASVYLARRFLDRRSFGSLGLGWNRQAAADLLYGVMVAGLMMGLVFLVEWAAGWLSFEGFAWQFESWPRVLVECALIAFVFMLVGWHEELLSRGYWLQNLGEGLNLPWGVSLSSALFALAHIANPNVSWGALLGLFAAGLFLAYGYLRTQQLWLPIGLHIGWNFFEGTVFGFPVSGSFFYRLIRQSISGPELITGGEFGPEAGLIILPMMALGAGLIYWFTRQRRVSRIENRE
ncbi:MAG TPA: type II CAAX endopeptidase family protein [Anaerolineales bacterium]|nr:type II CAAX endopeptidase family protein [Anaerolineales bacterium]